MRSITLEEHFLTQSFVRATGSHGVQWPEPLQAKLLDLGAGRIADMDEAGVDLQILSLAAIGMDELDAGTATPLARDINDELASAVKANPARLAGFATLALKDPAAAAAELDRCVSRLGFYGALVDGTTGGLFLDDARFLPFFEAAVHLGVPVYLHPAPPARTGEASIFLRPAGRAGGSCCRLPAGAGMPRPACMCCASSSPGSSIVYQGCS